MKRTHIRRILSLVILASIGGCVTLDQPLSDIMDAKPDEALCGVWRLNQGADGDVSLGFVGLKSGETDAPQGLLEVALPSFSPARKTIEAGKPITAFVTRIKDFTYLNLLNTENEVEPDLNLSTKEGYTKWKAQTKRPVTLMKYKIEGDQLTVWYGGPDADWQPGGAMREKYGQAPEALADLIQKEGDTAIFPPDKKQTYSRVK